MDGRDGQPAGGNDYNKDTTGDAHNKMTGNGG
jgi:hypothetical protein